MPDATRDLHFPYARAAHPAGAAATRMHSIPITGALRPYGSALAAAEVSAGGPLPMAIAPRESLVLSVQLGRSRDGLEQKGRPGENTRLTGIRR